MTLKLPEPQIGLRVTLGIVRRDEAKTAMRSVLVVVTNEDHQPSFEAAVVDDAQMIETLAPHGADPALGERVATGVRTGVRLVARHRAGDSGCVAGRYPPLFEDTPRVVRPTVRRSRSTVRPPRGAYCGRVADEDVAPPAAAQKEPSLQWRLALVSAAAALLGALTTSP